jgi:hypothetical protein
MDELKLGGALGASLNRNAREIKRDRAVSVHEQIELIYKRKIEDMEMEMKTLQRKREGRLDMSPSNSMSLILAVDFDANGFVNSDLEDTLRIRELRIKIEEAKARYDYLFTSKQD